MKNRIARIAEEAFVMALGFAVIMLGMAWAIDASGNEGARLCVMFALVGMVVAIIALVMGFFAQVTSEPAPGDEF